MLLRHMFSWILYLYAVNECFHQTRTRQQETERLALKIQHPPYLTCDTLVNLFYPLKDFINTERKEVEDKVIYKMYIHANSWKQQK